MKFSYDEYRELQKLPTDWRKIPRALRKEVKQRDENRCVVCWRKYQLNVHHFYESPISHNPYHNTQQSDLVTLCPSCHSKLHTCDKHSPFFKLVENYLKNCKGESTTQGKIFTF